jgi:hypothetical protein
MAKVDALLWLANQRPLLETLPHVNEDYAELWSSLRENHSAPASLGGNAVYSQLRNLFKEHAPSGKYSPDLKLVVRVLAAVAESLPDAVAAPADVAVDIPMESIATSSPLPATAAGPAAPLHRSCSDGHHFILTPDDMETAATGLQATAEMDTGALAG